MQTYAKTKHINKLTGIDTIIFSLLCILIFYPPFFRGLFFQKELLITHILSFSLGAIWLYTKRNIKEFKLISSITDLCALAVVFMYFISTFYGVNTRLAIAEFLKYANYFLIYLMVRDYSTKYSGTKKIIINILLLSGVVVSIIGVGSATGTFSYNGAFVSGRINSTFQYPNTLAAYLFSLFILGLGLLQNSTNKKELYAYTALLNLFIFTFIPTMSRGMWLIAPIVLFIYFILIPLNKKLEMIIYSIITIVPGLAFSTLFIQGIESNSSIIQWMLLVGSICTTLVLTTIKTRYFKESKISYRVIISVITILMMFVGAMGHIALNVTQPLTLSNLDNPKDTTKAITRNISGILKNKEYTINTRASITNPNEKAFAGRLDVYSINNEGKSELLVRENINETKDVVTVFNTLETTEYIRVSFVNYYGETAITFDKAELYDSQTEQKIEDIKLKYKYIPEGIVKRIDSINIEGESVQARIAFYKDSFQVIKDYPIMGAGGGAWETLYSMYQSYMYWTTQAHNYFLQLWIEVGTVGLFIYALLMISLLYNLYKKIKNSDDEDVKVLELSIFISWITILAHSAMDFDLSLGAMQVLLWTLYGLTTQTPLSSENKLYKVSINRYIPIAIVLILFLGSSSLYRGQSYANKAIAAYNEKDMESTIEYFEKAQKLDPYTASYPTDLASLYRALGNNDEAYIDKAIKSLDRAVSLQPYNTKVLMKAVELNIQLGKFDEGLNYADETTRVQPMNIDNYLNQTKAYLAVSSYLIDTDNKSALDKLYNRISVIRDRINDYSDISLEPFKYNKELDYSLQKIDYLIDNINDMEKLSWLYKVAVYNNWQMDFNKDGVPDGTRVINTEKGNANVELMDNYISLVNDGEDYGMLRIDNLPLEPNNTYTLEIEYSSTLEDPNFDLYVDDYTDGTNRFATLDNIKQSKEFNTVQLKLTTTKDMDAGKQRVLIIHRGKDNGEIRIKRISIIKE